MSEAVIMRRGGGGGGLAFELLLSAERPQDPAENCLWLKSGLSCTGYVISPSQPADKTEGLVWIKSSLSGNVSFNALGENSLILCPTLCFVYSSGAWQRLEGELYQDGAWKTLGTYLYDRGWINSSLVGSLVSVGKPVRSGSGSGTARVPNLSYNSASMNINEPAGGYYAGMVYAKNKISLDNASYLCADFQASGYSVYLTLWSDIGSYLVSNVAKEESLVNLSSVQMDVSSLYGNYYIGISIISSTDKKSNLDLFSLSLI